MKVVGMRPDYACPYLTSENFSLIVAKCVHVPESEITTAVSREFLKKYCNSLKFCHSPIDFNCVRLLYITFLKFSFQIFWLRNYMQLEQLNTSC